MGHDKLSQDEKIRYSRQIIIPEIGLDGQRRLKQASVLLVGVGGLGSPAALYLAAAGVGHIGLVDSDNVELSNLHRQILHDSLHLHTLKVESGRERMLSLNPDIQVDAVNTRLDAGSAFEIAKDYDIILDCSDNFTTRYLINDLCVLMHKPEVYGAVFHFEGQVSVFDARSGPCYRCLYPNPLTPELSAGLINAGIVGFVTGVMGSLMASEAIKIILGIGVPLVGQLMTYDSLEASFQKISFTKRPDCPVCGLHPTITSLNTQD